MAKYKVTHENPKKGSVMVEANSWQEANEKAQSHFGMSVQPAKYKRGILTTRKVREKTKTVKR